MVTLAPTDLATIVTVNEARVSQGLPPLDGPDGKLTVAEYRTKYQAASDAAAKQSSTEPVSGRKTPDDEET